MHRSLVGAVPTNGRSALSSACQQLNSLVAILRSLVMFGVLVKLCLIDRMKWVLNGCFGALEEACEG